MSVDPEHAHQASIVELSHDAYSEVVFDEPPVDLPPQRGRWSWYEQRSPRKAAGKIRTKLPRELARAVEEDPGLAEQVGKDSVRARLCRSHIGEHEVKSTAGELLEEPFERALAKLNRTEPWQAKGGLEEPVCDRLGKIADDPDTQSELSLARAASRGLDELTAEPEDVVGVRRDLLTERCEHETTPTSLEKLSSDEAFESAELCAQGRVRDAKSLRGTRKASLSRNPPEVVEVVIVQPIHVGRTDRLSRCFDMVDIMLAVIFGSNRLLGQKRCADMRKMLQTVEPISERHDSVCGARVAMTPKSVDAILDIAAKRDAGIVVAGVRRSRGRPLLSLLAHALCPVLALAPEARA